MFLTSYNTVCSFLECQYFIQFSITVFFYFLNSYIVYIKSAYYIFFRSLTDKTYENFSVPWSAILKMFLTDAHKSVLLKGGHSRDSVDFEYKLLLWQYNWYWYDQYSVLCPVTTSLQIKHTYVHAHCITYNKLCMNRSRSFQAECDIYSK